MGGNMLGRHRAFTYFALCLGVAWPSSAADRPAITYVAPDGKTAFTFDGDHAGIGMTPAEQKRYRAAGGVIRDGMFSSAIVDCSSPKLQCINLDDVLVFAVDTDAFAHAQPYEVAGTKFVPTCHGVSRPPKCAIGSVMFAKGRVRGFFIYSSRDGVLVIGLDAFPPSELEEIYVLQPGTGGILRQK
jgi:hypothetical protein